MERDLYRFSTEGRLDVNRFVLALAAAGAVFVGVVEGLLRIIGPFHAGKPFTGLQNAAIGFVALLAIGLTAYVSALGVKRLHDRDKSGWWLVLAFIPVVGTLWSLVAVVFGRGTAGPNRYGVPTIDPRRGAPNFLFESDGAVNWRAFVLTVIIPVLGLRAFLVAMLMAVSLAVGIATDFAHALVPETALSHFDLTTMILACALAQSIQLLRVMRLPPERFRPDDATRRCRQCERLMQKSTTSLSAVFQGEAGNSSKASRAIAP